ncbi:MAG: TadE family protein [Planctomycetota bacterium]
MTRPHNTKRLRRTRKGAVTVELAVCLPLIITLVLGSVQACNLLYLRHALTMAAYEGTLAASRPDATTASIKSRVDQMFDALGIVKGKVDLSCTIDFADVMPGTEITITVDAPTAKNTLGPEIVPPQKKTTVTGVFLR